MFKEIIPNNEATICSKCTLVCCTRMPGAVFPQQFTEITIDSIKELLSNGYCLDWWEGDPTGGQLEITYYVRPRIKGYEDRVYHPAWGGACVFHSEIGGCKHKFTDRPLECQNLIPNRLKPGSCSNGNNFTKKDSAIAWIPYQEILIKAADLIKT